MKKPTKQQWTSCLIGLFVGAISAYLFFNSQNDGPTLTNSHNATSDTTPSMPSFSKMDNWTLVDTAYTITKTVQKQDFETFATYIHPEKGVRFTPYSTVNIERDLVFLPSELLQNVVNLSLHQWGYYFGSNEPISMTISDYFSRFVSPSNYANAPHISLDTILLSGNALENICEIYPNNRFVDFSYRSIAPELQGADWSSLKLVFEEFENKWYLIAVVHSQWTL